MDQPTLMPARTVGPDTEMLPAWVPLPGLGLLPVNAYLVRAREPVLVDTGLALLREGFLRTLREWIDPVDLRWIWLTHADADHLGNLREVLAEAPHARVVTNFLGAGKLGLMQMPVERVHLLDPGQALEVGDRQLVALRPPVYDAPETMAAFDTRTRHLFSADCFGAVMAGPAEVASDMAPGDLHHGQVLWAGIDAPWLRELGPARMAAACAPLRELHPSLILGSHLPPAAPDRHEASFQALSAAAVAPALAA